MVNKLRFWLKDKAKDNDYIADPMLSLEVLPISTHLILIAAVSFVLVFFVWAAVAKLDEITRGEGRVVSSHNMQVVQNLEGGIISKILVEEGDVVERDQIIMEIDDTRFNANLRESNVNLHALKIKMLRLAAEARGADFIVPKNLQQEDPERIGSERNLYNSRKNEIAAKVNVFRSQILQRDQEVHELDNKETQLKRNFNYIKKELELTRPLVAEGAASKMEFLRLERTLNDLNSEIEAIRLNKPKAEATISELNKRIDEIKISFKTGALAEFNATRNELNRLMEENVAIEDRVNRTQVRSPVKGTINQIKRRTIGGIVQPGQDLFEIVPLEDTLLVEARVKTKDIGFLRPGLKTTVKLTAYDYSVYGGLPAVVETISADAINIEGKESFYKVMVRTDKSKLISKGKELSILPGMSASVDILTGKKTVLDYILKPLLKTKQNAMTEK